MNKMLVHVSTDIFFPNTSHPPMPVISASQEVEAGESEV